MDMIIAPNVKTAIDHYRIWVLLVFKRERLRLEIGKGVHQSQITILQERLLEIDCSSMCIPGVTKELLIDKLNDMVKEEFLKNTNTEGKTPAYVMTTEGNLFLMQHYGRLLIVQDYVDTDFKNSTSSLTRLVNTIKPRFERDDVKQIQVNILNEIISNFVLVEEIRKFFNF